MKHKFLLAGLMFLFSLSLSAETYSGTCGDNLTWTLDTESGILTISGTGAMTNYTSSDNVPWYSYRSSIKTVKIGSSVTGIGDFAFEYYTSLTSVTIPNSITSIGKWAFAECYSLTSVTIPNSVTSIGDDAFFLVPNIVYNGIVPRSLWGARSLNGYVEVYLVYSDETKTKLLACSASVQGEITIGNSVTNIGANAFSGCSSLTSITVDPENPNYSDISGVLFNKKKTELITYPQGKSAANYAIPNSVIRIGYDAFFDCSSLTSITIPNSVTSIGDFAFGYCSSLTSITIPPSVKSIGYRAFEYCSSLMSITIPNSVTRNIGEGAFAYCKIDQIYFSGTMNEWCTKSFNPSNISTFYTLFINGEAVINTILPNSVTSIGNYAFEDCSSLTSITIPCSVTSIGRDAFQNCSNLTSISIPNSVTSIGDGAFEYCSSLPIIDGIRYADTYLVEAVDRTLSTYTIKEGTRWIGKDAFSDCYNMKSVIMESATPPSFSASSFSNKTIVYVPLGSLKAYQDDKNWKNYDLRLFDTTIKTSAVSPTSATVMFSASLNGEDKNKYIAACGIEEGEEFSGNTAEYIGLEPESEYADVPFYIRTTKEDVLIIPLTFTTSALELTTLASKAVSSTTSILLAETNMSDFETSCGFEWRRNDQPADMPSNQVLCPVANGLMAGRLKGLKDDVYYKYRAFYKSAAGNMFYGDWQYVFTGDVTVEFDPVLYTYAAQFVSERKATLKGYALAGSDDFTEQGFEYWAESRRTDAPARRAPQYAIGEKHTVKGTGISMRVTLEDLDEGTVYKYRTYAKVGGKTLYGSEMTFTTQGIYEDPIETDLESVYNADADSLTPTPRTPQARKYIRNGILYIERNGITYTAQGHRLY